MPEPGLPFWDDYASRVAELLPPLGPADGVAEADLDAAESRLGVRLPRLLREHYLKTGRRDDVNGAYHRLVPPASLNLFGGVLVFFEEAGNVRVWGVDPEDAGDDPPARRSEDRDELVWESEPSPLSGFLTTMLYRQAVRGGMPFTGSARIDETELPAIGGHWNKVDFRGTIGDQFLVFHRPGQLVCVAGRAPDLELHAGAKTREDFAAIRERLKIEWDE